MRVSDTLAAWGVAVLTFAHLVHAQPVNDACASATVVIPGTPVISSALDSTNDGSVSCSLTTNGDVYHRFTTTTTGVYTVDVCGITAWDTVLSLHTGCPADTSTEVACDDDGCSPLVFGSPSKARAYLPGGAEYIVRIAGFEPGMTIGDYQLRITAPPIPTGGCCVLGTCTIQTQAACLSALGTFNGPNSACSAPAMSAQTFNNIGAPAPIPDDSPAGITRTITVGPSFPVADVRVTLDIVHSFSGDLRVTLSKGTVVVPLTLRVGQPTAPLGFDLDLAGVYTFSDGAPGSLWDAGYTLPVTATQFAPGEYRASDAEALPVSLRQAFDGVNAAGDWTLSIADLGLGDAGVLNTWSIALTPATGPACGVVVTGACCTGTPQGGLGTICTVVSQSDCTSVGGVWRGENVPCGGAGNPVACCKVNFDQQGGVTIDDIFIFLNAWFAQDVRTDFDGQNGRNLDDIFIFLNAWFAGCPG